MAMTTARALAAVLLLAAWPAGAQTLAVEADVTGGYSTYEGEHVGVLASQLRAFGDLSGGIRYFVEGAWADRNDDDTDAFGAAYPYGGRVDVIEAYAERFLRRGLALINVRAGRYRTPFGIYSRSDYAYSGLSRPPLVRYEGYFALANTFLEHGAAVMAGVPQLTVETSLSAPADVGDFTRRSGVDSVTRVQAYYGPLIVGASHIRTNPYQPSTFAKGRTVFTGVDFRATAAGVQLWGEWLDGQPFDGTSTTGWHVNASVHRPRMGPVTAVARVEQLDYDTVSRFAMHQKRQSVGARVRIFRGITGQISVVREIEARGDEAETALDAGVTYSIRLR
jgi:hypothetical protein